jgi:hypothetical protein
MDAAVDVAATDTGTPAGDACGPRTISAVTGAPDVLILLDRSQSMLNDLNDMPCTGTCASGSKWQLMVASINQTVQATEGSIRWGMKMFPDDNRCGVSAGVTVPPGPGNAASIAAAMAATQPGGQTPTRLALQAAGTILQGAAEGMTRYVLLATDGLPNCAPDQSSQADDTEGALAAVQALASAGIPTFVVGVATTSNAQADAALSQLAMAGGRATTDAPYYYPVSDPSSLGVALSSIAGSVVSCRLALASAPPDPTAITVKTPAGATIPRDAANGWTYDPVTTAIVLAGSACADVRSGALTSVTVIVPC